MSRNVDRDYERAARRLVNLVGQLNLLMDRVAEKQREVMISQRVLQALEEARRGRIERA